MAVTAGPRRQGLTRGSGARLLRTVGGKPHAREEDHEEEEQKRHAPQESQEDFNAEPVDPDDEELRVPPPQASKPSLKSTIASFDNADELKKPPSRKRKKKLSSPPTETGLILRKPGAAKKTRSTAPLVPKRGQFGHNQVAKASADGNKETGRSTQTPPASSGDIWRDRFASLSNQPFQTGGTKDYGSRKMSSQSTSNIHTAPSSAKKRPGKSKTYSTKSKKKVTEIDNDNSSEISMADDDHVDRMGAELAAEQAAEQEAEEGRMAELGLRKVPGKKKKAGNTNGDTGETSAMNEAELEAELGKQARREELGLTGRQEASLPPSSAPQQDMDNIDDYVRELPAQAEEDTTCSICNEPVDQDYYWSFWKGLDKTVKHQAAFCHAHRKTTAQQQYLAEGYPSVDGLPSIQWTALPNRIKKHRMLLYSILTNETPSLHRTRYAPLALTGKAATAIPSKRTDLSPSAQRSLDRSALDPNLVYPGYYGPRGRRLITEAVMALLHAEIKRSADAVVLTSGPATFVQAVLVPEVAVRLIMEDLQCDEDKAEEVREATFDMGGLLHEEIEDRVEVEVEVEDEAEENDYHLH